MPAKSQRVVTTMDRDARVTHHRFLPVVLVVNAVIPVNFDAASQLHVCSNVMS